MELFRVHMYSCQAQKVLQMAEYNRIDFSLRADREMARAPSYVRENTPQLAKT